LNKWNTFYYLAQFSLFQAKFLGNQVILVLYAIFSKYTLSSGMLVRILLPPNLVHTHPPAINPLLITSGIQCGII